MSKKENVRKAVLGLAKKYGMANVTNDMVCAKAGIARGAFKYHMGVTFTEFVNELVEEGVVHGGQEFIRRNVRPDFRREQVLRSGVALADMVGVDCVEVQDLAEHAGVSRPTVYKHLGTTLVEIRSSIMQAAVEWGAPRVVAQGLARRDPIALQAPMEIRHAAIECLSNESLK